LPSPRGARPDETARRIVELLAGTAIRSAISPIAFGTDCKSPRWHYRRELDRGAARVEVELIKTRLAGSGRVAVRAIAFALQCRFGWLGYLPPASN
jgi:hypothetical protein